jgi:Tfp pilus assembly protein PilX
MRARYIRPHRQRGVTLLVALIMLVLLTLLALTSANVGRSTIQVVGNMQSRDESSAAARQTIEEVISSTRFFGTPNDAIGTPCDSTANTRCIDNNGDGTTDVRVALTPAPTCVTAQSVMNTALDVSDTEQAGCITGMGQSYGIAGSVTGASLCSDSLWEINAVATDAVTEASVQVTQGVSVRVPTDDIATSCP